MNKTEAIRLLRSEGWTKADAKRALKLINVKTNSNIDEMEIRRAASKFAGAELIKRQNLQRDQKGLVTRRNNEILKYKAQIKKLEEQTQTRKIDPDLNKQIEGLTTQNNKLTTKIDELITKNNKLTQQNNELSKANNLLKKDNRNLKNIGDAIKLKLTKETKHILKLENEIKKGLVRLIDSISG